MGDVSFAMAMLQRKRVLMSSSLLRISEHAPAEYHMISYRAQKECDWIADTIAHCRHGAANEGGTEGKSEYSSCGQNPQKVATEWIQVSHHLAGNLPALRICLSSTYLPIRQITFTLHCCPCSFRQSIGLNFLPRPSLMAASIPVTFRPRSPPVGCVLHSCSSVAAQQFSQDR